MGALARGNILARAGYCNDRNIVVVALKELLCPSDDVAHDNSGPEGEENMFVVGMKY